MIFLKYLFDNHYTVKDDGISYVLLYLWLSLKTPDITEHYD